MSYTMNKRGIFIALVVAVFVVSLIGVNGAFFESEQAAKDACALKYGASWETMSANVQQQCIKTYWSASSIEETKKQFVVLLHKNAAYWSMMNNGLSTKLTKAQLNANLITYTTVTCTYEDGKLKENGCTPVKWQIGLQGDTCTISLGVRVPDPDNLASATIVPPCTLTLTEPLASCRYFTYKTCHAGTASVAAVPPPVGAITKGSGEVAAPGQPIESPQASPPSQSAAATQPSPSLAGGPRPPGAISTAFSEIFNAIKSTFGFGTAAIAEKPLDSSRFPLKSLIAISILTGLMIWGLICINSSRQRHHIIRNLPSYHHFTKTSNYPKSMRRRI